MAETRMNAYYGAEEYNIQYFFYGLIAAFLRGSVVEIIQLCELFKATAPSRFIAQTSGTLAPSQQPLPSTKSRLEYLAPPAPAGAAGPALAQRAGLRMRSAASQAQTSQSSFIAA